MYAQISDSGIVLMVDDCCRAGRQYKPEELYHKDVLHLFVEVPEGTTPRAGWKYDAEQGTFTEPELFEYIEELNLYYNPYPQDMMLAMLDTTAKQTKLSMDQLTVDTDYRLLMLETMSMA